MFNSIKDPNPNIWNTILESDLFVFSKIFFHSFLDLSSTTFNVHCRHCSNHLFYCIFSYSVRNLENTTRKIQIHSASLKIFHCIHSLCFISVAHSSFRCSIIVLMRLLIIGNYGNLFSVFFTGVHEGMVLQNIYIYAGMYKNLFDWLCESIK